MKTHKSMKSENNIENTAGSYCQKRLVRIFARCICVTGICGVVAFLFYVTSVVWERSQGVPLKAWLEAFGIVGAASVGVGIFWWAARNAKF